MKSLLFYLLQVICISGILYCYYHIALRNKKFHRYNRFYLLAATVASFVIPFFNIPVYFTQTEADASILLQTLTVISSGGFEETSMPVVTQEYPATVFTFQNILYIFYLLVAFLVLLRIIISLVRIRRIIKTNPVEELDKVHFVNTNEPDTPFSFFRWLFWNKKIGLHSQKGEQIFRHELFHIEQKHSRDVMYMELLTVIFWINPFFHLVKKEIKAIHEFLADQFAITENKKWEYAELLLMQAFQTNHHLVNPFFHNQIKRRIAMITTSRKPSYLYLRKIMVLPLAVIAAALFAFNYKNKSGNEKVNNAEKTITVVIDAGHGGADAGAVAMDGTSEKDITLAIAKKIELLNKDKSITIILTRNNDTKPGLHSIVEITKKYKADLLISLHVNADPKKGDDQSGFELVIAGKNKTFEAENKILANILLNHFSQAYAVNGNILQREAGIYILDNAPCPSALVECGYLTNTKDLDYIKDPARQEEIAKAVLKSIEHYSSQHKRVGFAANSITGSDTVTPRINKSSVKAEVDDTKLNPVKIDGKLLVIDGQKQTGISADEALKALDIGKLQSVTVLKGLPAIEKYGKLGENGVIEIITKTNLITIDTTIRLTDHTIFDRVEIEPSFPGGEIAFENYIRLNQKKVKIPVENPKAAKGLHNITISLVVSFTVDTDGSVSDIKTSSTDKMGLGDHAIELIKNSPRWIPALQNGKVVRATKHQTVKFGAEIDKTTAVSKPTSTPGVLYYTVEKDKPGTD
ncbi:MAG: N-acetylmuramoyl-L-alanine amidase [Ferruginibacter sp.]|nr:N-acetylmuramoyl-L-alanine amidase [Chitinophagaceae bacterium]